MSEDATVIFSDGAAKGNPGPGGWGAIVATADGRVVELGGYGGETTNNRMELTAAVRALEHVDEECDCIIYTDSSYLIQGMTAWMKGWKKRGWRTSSGDAVLNRDLWERLDELQEARSGSIEWRHVRGHAGVAGNERADAIAASFPEGTDADLYDGPRGDYGIPLEDLSETTPPPSKGSKRRGRAYSYLSVVGGSPMRHRTWAECEKRVSGQPGARYKKAMSADEESEILSAWGYSTDDV